MLRTKLLLAAVAIAAMSGSLSCSSDTVFDTAIVYGIVRDAATDARLEGVLVEIGGGNDLTNEQGEYEVTSKDGERTLRATKEGYEPFSKRVNVCSGLCDISENRQNFRMTPL